MRSNLKRVLIGVTAALAVTSSVQAAEEPVVRVYNWSDYIAEDTLDNFTKETGIKVVYDVFDSNEVLEAKLLAGNTGYDVVVPSASFLGRQIQAGVFQELDKDKLSNYKNLDGKLLSTLETVDPGNKYAIPYLWGTTGIGYNVDKVKAALGDDAPVDSWDLVFKPENMKKLESCGVAFLDAPTEIFAAMLNYMGRDPNSFDKKDYDEAAAELLKVRPYIRYFHSSQYINDLANGDICVAIGWSGDVLQARDRADEADNGVHVAYNIPKEGALMWFDMMAIPSDAPHVENALTFLNYIMRPDVIAGISNYVAYANGNSAADPLVDEEVKSDPGIYPTPEAKENLFTAKVLPPKVDRIITRAWTGVKTGR